MFERVFLSRCISGRPHGSHLLVYSNIKFTRKKHRIIQLYPGIIEYILDTYYNDLKLEVLQTMVN